MMLALYSLGSNSGLTKLRCTLTTTTVVSVKGGVPPSLAKTRICKSQRKRHYMVGSPFVTFFFFTDFLCTILCMLTLEGSCYLVLCLIISIDGTFKGNSTTVLVNSEINW